MLNVTRELSGGDLIRPDAASGAALKLKIYPAAHWTGLADQWSALAESNSGISFYVSRRWVETWIEIFGRRLDVSVALFENEGRAIAACLLARSRQTRALIPLRRISLNAAGERPADTTYIEYNNLICRSGWEDAVASKLAAYISSQDWDEFALDGFVPGPMYRALRRAFAPFDFEEIRQPSYYVDLAGLRRSGLAYEEVLKSHRRRIVRQNIRAYSQQWGPLRLEAAQDLDSAIEMFEDLARLNRRRFAGRRGRSVFESPVFTAFHRKLIGCCYADGSMQFLRLTAGSHPVGLVYNFVFSGKVYFYQCGFDYELNDRLSPGIVTLAFAVQHCLELGYDAFDFLSGEANYKRMLSTGAHELVWAVFRRGTGRVRIMNAARAAKRGLWRLVSGNDPDTQHDV